MLQGQSYQKGLGLMLQDQSYLKGVGLMLQGQSYLKGVTIMFRGQSYQKGVGLMSQGQSYLKGNEGIQVLSMAQIGKGPLLCLVDKNDAGPGPKAVMLILRAPVKVMMVSRMAVMGVSVPYLVFPPVDAPYKPPGFRDSRTYGDYGFEGPPGLEARTEGPAPDHDADGDVRPLGTGQQPTTPASAPSPMDVLITGMTQLQQVLLKQKTDMVDIEAKAVTELMKLPEYTAETGAIDFQDYLYLAEQQIATLAAGASDWWAQTLRVAQSAYAEYQTLSPVKRLSVSAVLTPELRDPKFQKLERKVASLVLASLPKGVRDDLIAYRVQGVHQILYRLMVIFQPGGAQDRAQLLKQLDVTESASSPGEAIISIRRWFRLLQRARDLGVTLPDESLQVKSLSMIVRRVAEQNSDFKFRLALARTELQVDIRPTPDNEDELSYGSYLTGNYDIDDNRGYRRRPRRLQLRLLWTPSIEMIQKQLDEVRRLKVLVVRGPREPTAAFDGAVSWYETRLKATTVDDGDRGDEGEALLDSGASHAFRPPISKDELLSSRKVGVSLATGEERSIPQNSGGTLLGESERDSTILPMGQLVTLLGCRVTWTPSKLTVVHPAHGRLQVKLRGHCPVLPVTQALSLISELEQKRMESFERTVQDLQLQVKTLKEKGLQGWSWESHLQALRTSGDRTHFAGFLHKNPVFSTVKAEVLLGVPEYIPREDRDGWNLLKGTPLPRAKRKALYQSDGWVVHLFSGDSKLEKVKSSKEVKVGFWADALTGNDVMFNVDLTDSKFMDVTQRDSIFRVLAWGALSGKIKSIIGGPPRQSYPTSVEGNATQQHSKEEQLIVKMMTLYYLAQEGRTALWHTGRLRTMVKPHVGFLIEHPRVNEGPLLSLFQMPLWKMFALDTMMGEVPCLVNERKVTLGGNLNLWHLRDEHLGGSGSAEMGSVWPVELIAHLAGGLRAWVGLRNHESLLSSLVRSSWVQDKEELNLHKFDVHDWKLHVQRDHLPYRRDCRECIERALGKPHRKQAHPTPCTLSIDTAGPFRVKGNGGYHYLLVGCYRHPKLKGTQPEDEKKPLPRAEEAVPGPDDGQDWIFEDSDGGEEELAGGAGPIDPGEPLQEEGNGDDVDKEVEALKELAAPVEFVSVYLSRPLRTRKKVEALKATQEMYIQLRSSGFPVNRLHMDRAREFQSGALEHWAAARDVELSRTQGSDPAQNGTAERAVGYVKMRMRILLAQAKELSGLSDDVIKTFWPMAADTAVAQQQSMALGRKFPSAARFGSRIYTKRKGYGTGGSFELKSKWIGGVYLGPARTVPGGHLVYTDEENLWFTTNVRQFEDRVVVPASDGSEERDLLPARRVKGKTSVVELASGAGLMPGVLPLEEADPLEKGESLKALAMLAESSGSEVEVGMEPLIHDGARLCELDGDYPTTTCTTTSFRQAKGLAGQFLREKRFSMEDCLSVLEAEQRNSSRRPKNSEVPRGRRMIRLQCTLRWEPTSEDLCTDVHSDRFNLRNSTNYVLTLGSFEGGGIWQQGTSDEFAKVSVESSQGEVLEGFVMPVKAKIVRVDPKRLHRTMPWIGGPKWTVIAHTIGHFGKLKEEEVEALRQLGFPIDGIGQGRLSSQPAGGELSQGAQAAVWHLRYSPVEADEEMLSRMWTRRVLDEEEQLARVVPEELVEEYEGVLEANAEAAQGLHHREEQRLPERLDDEQWLGLCRMTEAEEEMHGVETMLEELTEPLKVVFTVALDEVKQYAGRWSEAIHKEAKALLDAGALVPLTAEEQSRLERSGRLVVLPAKGVFTVKPPELERLLDENGDPYPKGSPRFVKRKARLVICGNFQGRQAKEDSYAGGCQIDSLRTMLVLAAAKGWSIASTDIRNAFILAPIKEEDEDDDDTVYGLFPPRIFQRVVVPYCYQLWRVDRALYGFRRSPRLWSKFRDRRLRAARVPHGEGFLILRQCKADENVWAIVYQEPDKQEEVKGYMNIYVDDVLYVGIPEVILVLQQWLTSEWKASDLTWASESEIIRFLGLEVGLYQGGVKIGQQAYVDELIRHHKLQDTRGYGTPCPQEWLLGECEDVEVEYTAEQLRKAQVLTGELLWLSGRSRPDLMHSVATMSCLCIKNPELVERIGYRVLGYLKATAEVCLWYKPDLSVEEVLGYSDASFAPQGARSVGCSVACFLNCPVSWRCGRQSLVALSVAEAELIEAVNCVQMMLGLAAFADELWAKKTRHCLRVDNQAAVGLTTEAAGTWKTRHLRVRSFALREAVRLEELAIRHVPGVSQLGDLGTKCFHRPRLEQLRELWGLRSERDKGPETAAEPTAVEPSRPTTTAMNGMAGVLARLTLIIGWLVDASAARETETHPALELNFAWELYGMIILAIISAIGLWELAKWILMRCCGGWSEGFILDGDLYAFVFRVGHYPDPNVYEVMHAQDAMTTPQHAGPVLEGETLGTVRQGQAVYAEAWPAQRYGDEDHGDEAGDGTWRCEKGDGGMDAASAAVIPTASTAGSRN
ncbi:GIP [Symbiodinium microadriaticum]|nr:GIP [Symbiodinium microadriaticum]